MRNLKMNMPIVFLFSGQGSQYYHMGSSLFKEEPCFREMMMYLDEFVMDYSGNSIIEHLYSQQVQKSDIFDRIHLTHPAIFMVEVALAHVLMDHGIRPDYVLGSSLGEFAAATVAGAVDHENAVLAVVQQARIIDEYCPSGSMTAVMGDPDLFYGTPQLQRLVEMAGVNFDAHFVLSGANDALRHVEDFLEKQTVIYQRLPVSKAFHSSHMKPAARHYKEFLEDQTYNRLLLPMISCSTAGLISELNRYHFWNIVHMPMKFQETIRKIEETGPCLYVDLGPSGTLATFLKYILSGKSNSLYKNIMSPFGNDWDNWLRLKGELTS